MSTQIIKLRRGSLEALSAVTASLQKGEMLIATGSSNLSSVTNGKSLVFAVPENGQVQASNRFLVGSSAPSTFAASTYNGMVDGVPYYDSGSGTLYLLGGDGNTAINLIGNIQPFSQSIDSRVVALESSLGGGGSIGSRVSALESSSIALGQFTQSADNKFSDLATYTGSVNTKLTEIGVVSGSLIASASSFESRFGTLATYTGSVDSKFTEIGVVSGSLISSASAAKTTNDAQDVSISNLNSFTQSFSQSVATDFSASAASVAALSASVASVTGNFSSSVATSFSASEAARVALSSSVATSFGNVANEQSAQDNRLSSLENATGSYAKLSGGNVFDGTQVITGSLYITQDLVVYGSSSLLNVTASRLDLGDNTIILNTATPAVRFAGIDVIDSGSTGATGSFYWDSQNNHWLYVHPSGSGEVYNSSLFIAGPKNTGSLGDEQGLTLGVVPVGDGDFHIKDSNISTDGTKVTIAGGLDVTGEISSSTIAGIGNVSAFSQSVDSRLDTIETSLGGGGSIGARVAALETFSGSQEAKDSTLATYTGSVDNRLNNLELTSASVNTSVSNLNSFSSSQLTQNSTLATYTGSVETRMTEIGVVSGSLISSASAAAVSISNLNASSASQQISIDNLNSFSSSANTIFTEIGVVSGSLIASASAAKTTNDAQDARLSSLETFSGSQLTQNSTLATYTGSVESRFSTLATYTGSVDGRLNNLESTSASVNTSVSNLNSFSSSVDTKFGTLATLTGSIATEQTAQNNRLSAIEGFTSSFGTSFSSSVDSRLDTLEGTGTIQGVGTTNDVTFNSLNTAGNVIVGGDLVVQGNTVTLNTSQLVVEDKLITLASGSTSSATADGAGIEVAGAGANFVYQHSTTAFTSSVALIAPEVTASVNLGTAAGNTKRVAFRNTNGNLDLVPTASVAGDLLQWNGTDFVMSNVIDGGSF